MFQHALQNCNSSRVFVAYISTNIAKSSIVPLVFLAWLHLHACWILGKLWGGGGVAVGLCALFTRLGRSFSLDIYSPFTIIPIIHTQYMYFPVAGTLNLRLLSNLSISVHRRHIDTHSIWASTSFLTWTLIYAFKDFFFDI